MRTDVVVVGAGAMGAAATWALSARGLDVVLLEQFSPGHDLSASHGSTRIFRLAYPDDFHVRLARSALPVWRRLEAESGEVLLEQTGAVDHGPAAVVQGLADRLHRFGESAELLDRGHAHERWPGLRFDEAVCFHPAGGRAYADRTLRALLMLAGRRGAQLHDGLKVERLAVRSSGEVDVVTADGVWTAPHVVVAAGAWTGGLLRDLVALPELLVTQVQPAHFPAAHPALGSPRAWPSFIHYPGAGLDSDHPAVYGQSGPHGVKVGVHGAGRPVDPASRDGAVDPLATRRVTTYVERWVPGVDYRRPEPQACTYTSTVDERFVVDRAGPITVAAGFSGHGFKFAPLIGELVADITLGVRPAPEELGLNRPRVPVGG